MVRRDAPSVLFIDELYALVYGRNAYSDEYNIILKTGRSLPVGSISLTQELSRIPANAYKQSSHRLGFYIEGEYDRRIRNQLLKKQKVPDPEDTFGFYYQNERSRSEPRYFKDVQTFLGHRKDNNG